MNHSKKNTFLKAMIPSCTLILGAFGVMSLRTLNTTQAATAPSTGHSTSDVLNQRKQETSTDESNHAYAIGSVSKMYTTAAVMKLVEEHRIDLDEPVTTYLPEFTMVDERYKQITPRMLLNHTSGLNGTTNHDTFTFGVSDTRYHDFIFLSELSSQVLKADPGSYSVYCNDGFTLAELMIEKVTQMSFPEYLEQTFFEPMGLTHTFTTTHNFQEDTIADRFLGGAPVPYIDCHTIGSGGLYSTASDVAKFGQLFTKQGPSLLSKESIEAMAESTTKKDSICYVPGDTQYDYGLGWDCVDAYPYNQYGIRALTKGGSVILSHGGLVVLPELNLSACMLISGGSGTECIFALQDMILEILREEQLIEDTSIGDSIPTNIKEAVALPYEFKSYAGYYNSMNLLKVSFNEKDQLVLQSMDEDASTMTMICNYIGDGNFIPINGTHINSEGALVTNSHGNTGTCILHFTIGTNQETYLCGTFYESLYELGESGLSSPLAQKITSNPLPEDVEEAWSKRNHTRYFLAQSVYNSYSFIADGILELECFQDLCNVVKIKGSSLCCTIHDANTATCDVDIPVFLGRDLPSLHFTGHQLTTSTLNYIDEASIETLDALPDTVTMNQSEQTLWYSVKESSRMTITVPEHGAYYVYDEDCHMTASSLSSTASNAVVLPANGYLVLAGEPDATFTIHRSY